MNIKKTYLLLFLVIERGIELIVIKKTDQFLSFKLGDVQLLDILNNLARTTRLGSSLKAYKTSETKNYFPHEWFNDPEKLNNTQLPLYETFFSKLPNSNPLEKDYSDFQSSIDDGLTSIEALMELKNKQPPAIGQENYQYVTSVSQQENMCTLKDFFRWYDNNHVVPTLKAM